MTSQPNQDRGGNLPRAHLSANGELIVSATETFRALWSALGIRHAPPLEALLGSSPRAACYLDKPAPAGRQLSEGQVSPSAQRLKRMAAGPLAEAATSAGCPTITWRVWSDEHRVTYAEERRTIEVLRVEKSFDFTIIDPAERSDASIFTNGQIGAGDYLVASVGEDRLCVRMAGRTDRPPSTSDLAAQAACAANALRASCSRCRQGWLALDGLDAFHPIESSAPRWRLSEVDDLGRVTGTVACVLRDCTGRISFHVTDLPR